MSFVNVERIIVKNDQPEVVTELVFGMFQADGMEAKPLRRSCCLMYPEG